MTAKQALTWFGVAVVVVWVLAWPRDAGGLVASTFTSIEQACARLGDFVTSLA